MLNAFCAWRSAVSSSGSVASVPRYSDLACCTSSSDSFPLLNRLSVISRLRRCSSVFSCAMRNRSSSVRMVTYRLATCAASSTWISSYCAMLAR